MAGPLARALAALLRRLAFGRLPAGDGRVPPPLPRPAFVAVHMAEAGSRCRRAGR